MVVITRYPELKKRFEDIGARKMMLKEEADFDTMFRLLKDYDTALEVYARENETMKNYILDKVLEGEWR